MIWALLAAFGVPLWICALAILALVFRNRALRRRPGNLPVRLRAAGSRRWRPGHAVWIHDVFAFRGSPAAWSEALLWVTDADVRPADAAERRSLHRVGGRPVVATFATSDGDTVEVAARGEDEPRLLNADLWAPAGGAPRPRGTSARP